MLTRPISTLGMRHLALNVVLMEACEHFYVKLLGMKIEWQPDQDNLYLTNGSDNLALHRSQNQINGPQHLDHFGFILNAPQEVDKWYAFLHQQNVFMKSAPRSHRDGAYSFYCQDPDGNTVQFLYHPPLVR